MLPFYDCFREGGFLLLALVAAFSLGAAAIHWKGEAIANLDRAPFSHLAANMGTRSRPASANSSAV